MQQSHSSLYRVHDLVNISSRAIRSQEPQPDWLLATEKDTLWAVVRRARVDEETLPIGFRGRVRRERWATEVPCIDVLGVRSPRQLRSFLVTASRLKFPAMSALICLENAMPNCIEDWGPTGSVGFEIATGCPVVSGSSDLDVAVYIESPEEMSALLELWTKMSKSGLPIDLLIETRHCGFSLREFAERGDGKLLVRTADGRSLTSDPWSMCQERL